MSVMRLRASDYQRILTTLLRWNECRNITSLSRNGILALQALIPATAISVQHLHSNNRPIFTLSNKDWPYRREEVEAYLAKAADHPLTQHYMRPANLGRAIRLSDIVTLQEYKRHPLYRACHARLGIAHILSYSASSGPHRIFAVGFDRTVGDGDFSLREKAMLQTLGPHLAQQFHRFELGWGRNRPWKEPTTADWLAGALLVSNREAELLLCLLDGLSNREIATRTGIAEATVKRHFTNAFAKINVTNRLGAVQKVRTAMLRDGTVVSEVASRPRCFNATAHRLREI